jgi:hypothetical protein
MVDGGNVLRRKGSRPKGLASARELLELLGTGAPGPAPSFTGSHMLLAFLTIANSSYVGRQTLATKSRLGEGATRTIIGKLKDGGYVDTIRSGCFLTRSGKSLARSLHSAMSDVVAIPRSDLTMGPNQAALVLRDAGKKVGSGIEQRDSAIRIGAAGATTYVMNSGRFTIPGGSSNCEKDFPSQAWSYLKRELNPRDDDVVILCGAADDVSARLGALAAAITLL